MSGMRQKIQYSLALEPAHQGETPVGGCQGTEPFAAKPAPQSPALAPTSCRCPSLTPSNRRVRDPYARWCGRGGTARCPPIPIFGPFRTFGLTYENRGSLLRSLTGTQDIHARKALHHLREIMGKLKLVV